MQREEYLVPRSCQNVIPLHSGRSAQDLPVSLERLGVAVHKLDGLHNYVTRIVRDPRWSALEWSAACTPLMLQLPEAQESLADLARIRASGWPDTDWAVRLSTARDEVERLLLDVCMSVSVLAHQETSSIDTVADFIFDGTNLTEALKALSSLIANQYPTVADDI
jgi:hypothetical protein